MGRKFSVRELVNITGKSDKTIKARLENLVPEPGPRGAKLYDSVQALNAIFNEAGDLSTERAKLTVLQQQKAEIEIARLRGELVPIEEVASVVEKEYAFVRAQIRSLPSKLAKPLSMVTDPHEVQTRLDEAVNECLSELVADTKYQETPSAEREPPFL